jgi:hypothetical protein
MGNSPLNGMRDLVSLDLDLPAHLSGSPCAFEDGKGEAMSIRKIAACNSGIVAYNIV